MRLNLNLNTALFWAFHLLCLLAFVVPIHLRDLILVFSLYAFRMFFVTAGYHRYFSHRAFSTSRVFQFVLAFFASSSSQKGVLWWASHHRYHHRHSDKETDIHSPKKGFYWSHVGWFLSDDHDETDLKRIQDFAKYPELVWLNRYWQLPGLVFSIGLYIYGGWTALFWGGVVSTVLLWHGTFTINSLSHVWGSRRYETSDTSRNNGVLAIVTLGEGWHNNHHRYPSAARNGFFWWEYDLTFYGLKVLSWIGVIWDLRPAPSLRS